uniref:Uncharacterized protein n=1 Tax=Cacopsylla melanoneura TaxID=428564 RepID=A0A8D8Y8I6_9HEMI
MSGNVTVTPSKVTPTPRLTQFVCTPPSLWRSPASIRPSAELETPSSPKLPASDFDYENLLVQIEFDQVIEKTIEELQAQAQQRRLKDLRKELTDFVKRTEWRYTPVEKLLGFDVKNSHLDKKE